MTTSHHLLLLAGSGDAREIAARLSDTGLRVTASQWMAEHWSGALPVPTRHGGFGGEAGFRSYLQRERISAVLDATHPYAARISARSFRVCDALGLPYLQLDRPAWRPGRGDRWTELATPDEAVRLIQPGARVFTSFGRQLESVFEAAPRAVIYLRRLRDDGATPRLKTVTYVTGNGPFSVDHEARLFRDLGITLLLVKNSGGDAARSKLDAARRLGLPVGLLRRPPPSGAPLVHDVQAALDWVAATCR
jgi:precorrin-6A/cobalt-precorrin-6A reductase